MGKDKRHPVFQKKSYNGDLSGGLWVGNEEQFYFCAQIEFRAPRHGGEGKKKKHLSLGCKGNVGDLCPYTKKISYISKATIFVLSNESNYSFWLMFYKGMCLFEVDASDRK